MSTTCGSDRAFVHDLGRDGQPESGFASRSNFKDARILPICRLRSTYYKARKVSESGRLRPGSGAKHYSQQGYEHRLHRIRPLVTVHEWASAERPAYLSQRLRLTQRRISERR